MANSIRQQIIDAIVALLGTSTGITTVEDNLYSWSSYNEHQFPVATVMDRDTDIMKAWQYSTSNPDKEADMEVTIRGYLQDNNNVLNLKRNNFIRDVQKKMVAGSSTLNPLVYDIDDATIETDDGIIDNYSIVDITYHVIYQYNHNTP